MAQRSHHERQQFALAVIARDAVHVHDKARLALVHNLPLAVGPGVDRDRLHAAMAFGGAIPRIAVKLHAPQAPGTVVAIARAQSVGWKYNPAMPATQIGRWGLVRFTMTGMATWANERCARSW